MLEKIVELYDLAYKNRSLIILIYGILIFLYMTYNQKQVNNFHKKEVEDKKNKEFDYKAKKAFIIKQGKKIDRLGLSFIILAFIFQEYKFVIVLLVSEVFKCRAMIRNHENTIEFYESKGYNDWLKNVNKSQENEEDNE
ncbi:hypothetical protein [Cetobacterium sp.]|uniref:hypothetical protein n=1 Tax=Cetobacterium sp. TaxID=2071632 RepID=UPI003F31145A